MLRTSLVRSDRIVVWAAAAAASLALTACPGRTQPDGGSPGGGGGTCVAPCGTGGGTAGGSTGGGSAGGSTGGGNVGGGNTGGGAGGGSAGGGSAAPVTVSLAQVRQQTRCITRIKVVGAVVTAVDSIRAGAQGDFAADFWVADPANPTNAIFVSKFFTDGVGPYAPAVGDVVTIEGYHDTASWFDDRTGYRHLIKSQFGCGQGFTGTLVVTKTGTMSPLNDNQVSNGFGVAADGGSIQANPEFAGARVFVPGPLTLSDPSPMELKRVSAKPNDDTYFGFKVTGGPLGAAGILVNNYKTFGTSPTDGGPARCDWRVRLTSGDAGSVTFPNGIRGVWDSYTHAPCEDGGVSPANCGRNFAGSIPGTPDAGYTFVLYPLNCDVDLVGQAQ